MLALQLACGGWIASAVGAVARLGVPDLLADGPRSAAELAETTGTSEAALARVLRLLVALDLFAASPDGRITNTPDSEVLRTDHPRSMRHFCMLAAGEYQRVFHDLMHTLETGAPAAREALGDSIYGYMETRPDVAEVYDAAMEDLARPVGALLSARRDLSGVGTVVDVGGGRGTVLHGLLAAVPHVHGVCVDRPDVCRRAEMHLHAAHPGLVGRLTFQPGDFFETVPAGGDLYILKNVLHNWSDDSAIRILGRVREAMEDRAGSRLLVIEPTLGGEAPSVHQAMDDLLQVVLCEEGTAARSHGELVSLLGRAGLEWVGTVELPTGHAVIEGSRAQPTDSA